MPTKRYYKSSGRSASRRSTTSFGGARARSGSFGGARTSRTNARAWKPTTTYSPAKFSTHRKQVQAKICSLRTINQQIAGAGQVTAFSPTNINRWINFVNSGANVYKFTGAQWSRSFGRYFNVSSAAISPSIALRALQRQFGSGIKAVTKGKGNAWLVVANQNVNASPFKNYNWQ